MRSLRLGLLAALLLWPAAALAAPPVSELVEAAVRALKAKSYEGRLRFLSQYEDRAEQVVQIYHVAPDLYRVNPLAGGLPIQGEYFIENAAELVRVDGNMIYPMPERQFSVSDAMTMKFLRDLGNHPGTTLLEGKYNGVAVYILRQDVTKAKPYLVTVGLNQQNSFPMFVEVSDAQGRLRVNSRFEKIKFVQASELPDEKFTVPPGKNQEQSRAPQGRQRDSSDMAAPAPPAASEGGSAKAAPSVEDDLPLYPGWLPEKYKLEAISVLEYAGVTGPSPLYEFEAYGPRLTDMVSIFQMQCDELGDCDLSRALAPPDGTGYLLEKHGDWVVVVFGVRDHSEMEQQLLKKVIAGLEKGHADQVMQLLTETRQRDKMLEEATRYR